MAKTAVRLPLAAWLLVCLALGVSSEIEAQSADVVPEALRRVPIGDIGVESYWQQVSIQFGAADAPSDSTARLVMPSNVEVRDSDGDGELADEVRVMYAASGEEEPGFFVSPSTIPEMIVVGSSQEAAAGGILYLQFPIRFGATSELGELTYGAVLFAEAAESDIIPGPVLTTIDPDDFANQASTNLVVFGGGFAPGADTTTSVLGAVYPDLDEVVVTELPDLVFDNGVGTSSNTLGFGDGDDSNDVEYRFFFSTDAGLVAIESNAVVEAQVEDGSRYMEQEGGGRSIRLLTRDLPIGTHYLYVTSSVTGNVPLGRSRGLTVRHQPQVDRVGPAGRDLTLDSGGLLDSLGLANGRGSRWGEISYAVTDHDDTAAVYLFYSTNPDLGADGVQGGPDNITGLSGASPIASAQGVRAKSGAEIWNVVDPVLVAQGEYYIYAVASDASAFQLGRSSDRVVVRHSPNLRLDVLDDQVLTGADTIVTGGMRPQQFVTITWGRSGRDGDGDLDDNAEISLYYSTMPATATDDAADSLTVPGGAEALRLALGTTVHRIAEAIPEDPDERADNLFVWDVWGTAAADSTVPRTETDYFIYGIIEDSTSSLLVQLNGGRLNDAGARLRFEHPPSLRMLHPIADIEITNGGSARVSWEDTDLDNDARLRVILSREDHGEVADYTSVLSGFAFVVNSEDGSAEADTTASDLSEDDEVDFFDVGVSHIAGIQADTSYFAYVAITETGRFDAATLACRTRGKVGVRSASADTIAVAEPVFQLLPSVFTLGNGGMPQSFDVRVNAAGQPVDLVQLRLSLDGGLFEVVDRDTAAGIQPFVQGTEFSAARVFVNEATATEAGPLLLDFTYFDPISAQIENLDGETTIASFQLLSRDLEGPVTMKLDADPEAGRVSLLEHDRISVASPAARDIATGLLVSSRGTIRGNLALEGRSDHSSVADLTLRRFGSYLAVEDSVLGENDIDQERQGIQVAVQQDGSFELLQVPAGRYELKLHVDGFLDGLVGDIRLAPTQELEGLRAATSGSPADSIMLGGDVAGYSEVDGVSQPDNEITLSDWDFVAALFKREVSAENDSARADITADGVVDISDLSLVGANFLSRGPKPVYKRPMSERGSIALIRMDGGEEASVGDEQNWAVDARGFAGVRGVEIEFDLSQWEPVSVRPGALNSSLLMTTAADNAAFYVAAVARGDGPAIGQGALAVLRLRAGADNPRAPTIGNAAAVDVQHKRTEIEFQRAPAAVLPERFSLDQNYPNPFNPETTIAFAVGSARRTGALKLEIFDILGQLVDVLWEGPLDPGRYSLTWDGRDRSGRSVASGVYLYRLQSGSDLLIRRMVLVR